MLEYFQLIGGLILLLIAGDALVSGAASLAIKFKISPLVIGLTVIAFGTSAPELFVSLEAAFNGTPGIAIGNVVGSNIANILLVLGLPAIFYSMNADNEDVRKNMKVVMLASLVFAALVLTGVLAWWHGAILFAGIVLFLYFEAKKSRDTRKNGEYDYSEIEGELDATPKRGWKIGLFLLFGIAGLPFGAHYLVAGASTIALDFGLSEAAIGLTVVALGTSLPELAAVFSAVRRKESDLAIGNILGSNLFNMLAVMGLTALVHPVAIPDSIINVDIWIMLAVTILLYLVISRIKNISTMVGGTFVAFYVFYIFTALG
ncbi:MAG: calcium/sodium antiporter [Alphaproteobacteria bacterium]|nr:calcium/sodium antiporter [Alphaproteobacteria bacterium]